MTLDPVRLAVGAAWLSALAGLGLWVWMAWRCDCAITKMRLYDCGVVLVFSAVLTWLLVKSEPMNAFDWAMVFLGPLFIAAALWRLNRTRLGR
ncbi:MAG: hypothetical protein KJ676_09080 [Alphaproteobacteria bacterium]|jgi:hypothetical protein|nr:hypothetical protein [Alphaproteobacteria bacterium]MBU1525501.1 hypothetical protein [Alphaproteobacteria bacterium]MBU2117516.1 hypothetical protein [Alphaproteobacteria bacterium]MBU2350903.1 hypothetical protein [Alphaproteobacteria bacterium]MBU2381716.1 hypothetical protein [Alphaproteobacteria bacterium]